VYKSAFPVCLKWMINVSAGGEATGIR